MANAPWKEASTLIIAARASVTQKIGLDLGQNLVMSSRVMPSGDRQMIKASKHSAKIDYRILMVKRSSLSSFMASAYVFPGGHVEMADYSPKWWGLFEKLGINQDTLVNDIRSRVNGPRPPMIMDPITLRDHQASSEASENYLIPEIALRIAAIRETFEETGVPLLTGLTSSSAFGSSNGNKDLDTEIDLSNWRQKVRNDGQAFLDLCIHLNQLPDIWSLYEWWDWLTPISVGHKRFDTMFYICCLDKQPKVVLDNTEVTNLKWCTPTEILEEHSKEGVFLAPPQAYELARIENLTKFNSIQEFARKREKHGIERWMPVISTYNDGAISLLPGDDMYPEEPDIIGLKPVPDHPQTLAEMRAKAVTVNRIELRGPISTSLCNCKLTCGHLSPVTPPSSTMPVQSML